MKLLVHTDPRGETAYGIWWVAEDDGSLQHLYLDPTGPQAARGRAIMFNLAGDLPWLDRFNWLTGQTPYFENWVIYDSMGMAPRDFLLALNPLPPLAAS